jgi:hypothetical protein
VRNVSKRLDLLPIIELKPDQIDDAKSDSSHPIDVTADMAHGAGSLRFGIHKSSPNQVVCGNIHLAEL